MFSLTKLFIILVILSSLVLGIELIFASEEINEGKINLTYFIYALGISVFIFMYLIFLIMFIKKVWLL